jgi:hypothetical protein
MAWACYPHNTSLAIAANVFTYVGTIILFMIDWFFVQRIIRAQHARLGWSTPYRIFHRAGLVLLVSTLIMLIVASIYQFFTLNNEKLHVFRGLQLTGQTYFTIFCFAPAVLVIISLLLPRHEIEKFGAGRLRVNITILLLSVLVLGTGQTFRCVIAWIPQTPMFDAAGRPIPTPWYLHKVCFWVFNFVTEIIVVIMFALVRVDLRFHIPNGSRMSGDYSGHNSRVTLNIIPDITSGEKAEKTSAAAPNIPITHQNDSAETLHQYNSSVFDDSNTLAESLRYPGSILEVDTKTGNWKVKRASSYSTSSRGGSIRSSSASRSSLHDRSIMFADEDAPPVPEIPAEWPLPASPPPRSFLPILEHSNPPSRRATPARHFEIQDHELNNTDVGDAITDALAALEQNSEQSKATRAKSQTRKEEKSPVDPSPGHTDVAPAPTAATTETPADTKAKRRSGSRNPLAPRDRSTHPPKSAMKASRSRSRETKASRSHSRGSRKSNAPTIGDVPDIPQPPMPVPAIVAPSPHRAPSLELITLPQHESLDSHHIVDMSVQGEITGDMSIPRAIDYAPTSTSLLALSSSEPVAIALSEPPAAASSDTSALPSSDASGIMGVERSPSVAYSDKTTSSDAREAVIAEVEFSRFSSEGVPIMEGNLLKGRSFD